MKKNQLKWWLVSQFLVFSIILLGLGNSIAVSCDPGPVNFSGSKGLQTHGAYSCFLGYIPINNDRNNLEINCELDNFVGNGKLVLISNNCYVLNS